MEYVPYLLGRKLSTTDTGIRRHLLAATRNKKTLDFGAPYHVLQSTYLAAAGSAVKTVAEANAPGVRIGGVANTATFRASQKASPLATHITMAGVDDAVAAIRDGKTDLIALSRESLVGVAPKIPGSRVLDGAILSSSTAVAVPKNKPAALAYVTAFMEEEKAAGNVRRYSRRDGTEERDGSAGWHETVMRALPAGPGTRRR